MAKDSLHTSGEWEGLVEAVETAARFRRLFPRDEFESLNTSQLQVLLAVAAWPDLTPGQLAECLEMEKSSISQPLTQLEAAGLAKTTTNSSDRRSKTSRLTDAGAALVSKYGREVLSVHVRQSEQ